MVENYFAMHMDKRQVAGISALGLAHMGDGVFELLVRSWLCGHGRTRVQNLHRETVSYVSAPAQSRFVELLEPLLTEEERDVYRRGGTPISTPSPSMPPPRNMPGPQDWSASLASCSWRGRRNESTSCLSQ